MGLTRILFSFGIILEKNAGKKILKSSRLEFLENISSNNLPFSYAEDSNLGPFRKEDTAD